MRTILILLEILAVASCAPRPAEPQAGPRGEPPTAAPAPAVEGNEHAVVGQTIYVPIYSHIYIRDKTRTINLAATLSIRNTDARSPIRITSARYYDTRGTLLKEYASEPLRLAPMASTDVIVAEDDTSGGSGANFIVEWEAGVEVTQPVVEAVMISTASQQGISFVSVGRVIKDRITPRDGGPGSAPGPGAPPR